MDNFNQNVSRMANMLTYGLDLIEIHDIFVNRENLSEEDFFLLYQAAKMLDA